MQPIETVLNRLSDHARSGNGYKASCPAHDDKKPSLSVTEGNDGRVLLNCHAGCTIEAVVEAMGLGLPDLHPKVGSCHKPVTRPKQTVFSSAEQAIEAYGFGPPSKEWFYTDASGDEVGRTLRWDKAVGKEIRPLARTLTGWALSAMAGPRPLLNLPALLANAEEPVYVVEGEKCFDALENLGLLATTSAGGANAAKQTDWSPLANRRVIVLPDNDDSGRKYAQDVLQILSDLQAKVSLASLEGIPEGGDVVDLIDQCFCDDERAGLREEITMLPDQLPTILPQKPAETVGELVDYLPFPVQELPEIVANYVTESAAATGCDPAFVALPVMTLLGAAIGNSRRLRIKSTYEVLPILWTGIVGNSGSGKTPALKTALAPAFEHDRLLRKQDTSERFLVVDSTTEALAEIMSSNPRGMLCIWDELAGFFGSIDRYTDRKKGCSSAQSFLLSAHEGEPYSVDRKTGDNRSLYIPRASLWLCGGIQPGILAQAMGKQEREAGLLPRLLLACPPALPHKYTDDDISEGTGSDFRLLLKNLFSLAGEEVVRLTPEAKHLWIQFHDQTSKETTGLTGDLAAAWSKFRDTALRIALVLHLASDGDATVSADTLSRSLCITRWFMQETVRVYELISTKSRSRTQDRQEQGLLEWMADRDWVTARDIKRGPRLLRNADTAEHCLDRLHKKGLIEKKAGLGGERGGRPTTLYRRPNSAIEPREETPRRHNLTEPGQNRVVSPSPTNGSLRTQTVNCFR